MSLLLRNVRTFLFFALLALLPLSVSAESCSFASTAGREAITIPDRDPRGIKSEIEIDDCSSAVLEKLRIKVDIRHDYRGDLKVSVVLPSLYPIQPDIGPKL